MERVTRKRKGRMTGAVGPSVSSGRKVYLSAVEQTSMDNALHVVDTFHLCSLLLTSMIHPVPSSLMILFLCSPEDVHPRRNPQIYPSSISVLLATGDDLEGHSGGRGRHGAF